MIIYKITNKVNNKFYIGKTISTLQIRWGRHLTSAKMNSQTHLHRAIRKHGDSAFIIEIVEDNYMTVKQLNQREIFYIAEMSPQYNMTRGGDGGDTSSSPNYIAALQKRDLSGSRNPNYGKTGILSPKFGKKYGPKPKISEAKKQPVMANGQKFSSIRECELVLKIKWYYSSRRHPDRFYKLPH